MNHYPTLEELEAKVAQAKKNLGQKARNLFYEGKNTVEIRETLGLKDLPFEMFLEVLGFNSIEEWKRENARIRRKLRSTDEEGNIWSEQRKKCLERDDHNCVVCGKEARNAHHIIPYRKSHSHRLENLVSLCDLHHDAIHCNLSMYQKKELSRVREYIKTLNKKFGRNLGLIEAFTTKSETVYYRITETTK